MDEEEEDDRERYEMNNKRREFLWQFFAWFITLTQQMIKPYRTRVKIARVWRVKKEPQTWTHVQNLFLLRNRQKHKKMNRSHKDRILKWVMPKSYYFEGRKYPSIMQDERWTRRDFQKRCCYINPTNSERSCGHNLIFLLAWNLKDPLKTSLARKQPIEFQVHSSTFWL